MLRWSSAAVVLFAIPAVAVAQEPGAPPDSAVDQEHVSTIARVPMSSFDVERSDNVVRADEIQRRQAKSITEALQEEPGIQVQSTNRGAGTLILRGLVGPENRIYFDGVRFDQSTFRTGPNQYLNTVDPWALSRIEVVRGPGSVLYGSGAMGGVVHLVPRALPHETFGRSRVGFESADSGAGAMVEAGTHHEGIAAQVGGTYRRHGRLRAGLNGGDFFLTGLQGDEFLASPYNEAFWRGGIGYQLDDHQLRANYFGGLVDDAMRIDRLGGGEVRSYDNQDHITYLTYQFDGTPGLDDLRANVSWHRTVEEVERWNCRNAAISDPRFDDDLSRVANVRDCVGRVPDELRRERRNLDEVDTLGTSVTGLSKILNSTLRLSWGAEAYHDVVESSLEDARAPDFEVAEKRGNFADGSTYTTVGAFGHGSYDVWSRGPHLFRAQAGARVENFSANAPEVTAELGDVTYAFTGVVGSAGVAYLNGTMLNMFLNWNQGFRAPNLQESTVLGDSGSFYEVPNPDLAPERSDTFELGAKIDLPDAVRLRPALWASLLSDRITRAPGTFEGSSTIDGKEVRQRVNRDSAYFYGLDLAAETTKWSGVSFYGNLSWIDGGLQADAEDAGFIAGPLHSVFGTADFYQNPRRLPPLTYLAGVRYHPENHWYFAFFLQGAGDQTKLGPDDLVDARICEASPGVVFADRGQSCPGGDGWLTFNAHAGYQLDAMSIDLGAMNLTDELYRRHGSGTPAPGFNFTAQMTLEY